jgi:hypothetical protein
MPNILAGKQTKLYILNQGKLLASIVVDSRLIELMAEIQKIIQERLLLFEDMSGFSETSDSSEVKFDESITRLTSHSFLKRNKVDRLIELLQELPDQSKILIFVRNKSICEGLSEILQSRGFISSFIHSDVKARLQESTIEKFKVSQEKIILILSRQLFGRGMDFPESDVAFFYSPKSNYRTIWQEALRIRGTVIKPKKCFILFYSWTSEASKFTKLLSNILFSGGTWNKDFVKWVFQDVNGNVNPERLVKNDENTYESGVKFMALIVSFIRGTTFSSNRERTLSELKKISEKAGLDKYWSIGIVIQFLLQVTEWFYTANFRNTHHEDRAVIRALSKLIHPDLHTDSTGEEKNFWEIMQKALNSIT